MNHSAQPTPIPEPRPPSSGGASKTLDDIPVHVCLTWIGAAAVTMGCFWALAIAYCLHGGMPFNPIRLPLEDSNSIKLFAPQGWKFFTRNAQEEASLLFRKSAEGPWRSASLGPNGRASNVFGLNRQARAQGIELGLLLQSVPAATYSECTDSPEACLDRLETTVTARNVTPNPTLCGLVGIAMQRPIPWAWNQSKGPIVMPSRVVKMVVSC